MVLNAKVPYISQQTELAEIATNSLFGFCYYRAPKGVCIHTNQSNLSLASQQSICEISNVCVARSGSLSR